MDTRTDILCYENVQDIPGYIDLVKEERDDVITYAQNYLSKPSLALQIVTYKVASKVAKDDNDQVIAAYGWHVVEHLGQGKDGYTFLGHKFIERGTNNTKNHIIKILSGYAQHYVENSKIFNFLVLQARENGIATHPLIKDQTVKDTFSYYYSRKPYKHVRPGLKELHHMLASICNMNYWCIRNTGMVFWDLGYNNGRNFMSDNKKLRWVDYGGAGILRCPNFDEVVSKYKNAPVLSLTPLQNKENLVIANSDFIMCQFLLNYEFHAQPDSTADIYASMLQVRKQMVPEIMYLMPRLCKSRFTQDIFENFKGRRWDDPTTWKELGRHIIANHT